MDYKYAKCKNCRRKLAEDREIIYSDAASIWVHNNPIYYDIKCHPFEEWVAEPMEE